MDFDFDLSRPQFDFFRSDAKYTAAVAGFGAGKTMSALQRIIRNLGESPGLSQAYLAPTYSLIRDIFYPKVEELMEEMGFTYRINHSKNDIHIDGLGRIVCRTMEKPESMVGWEVADAFLDELDILNTEKAHHVFRKTSARLRQANPTGRKNQLFVTTTPEGFKATYELFKKDPLENSNLIQMSTYSNQKYLPDDYIEELKNQYPDQLIDAYIEGQFVNLSQGAVYYSFDRDKHKSSYVVKPREPIHIGMDFNVYNMAAVVHVMREGKAYAVDEMIGYRDTPDIIEQIRERYYNHNVTIYPDASGDNKSSKGASLSDFRLLKDAGFKIKADKQNPRVRVRVQEVNNAFENGKYFVNVDRCPEYTLALEQQVYNERGDPDKDSGLDHPIDAGGYFIHQVFPMKQRQAITQLRMI